MCHITYCLQIISYFRFYFKTSLMITPIAIKVLAQDSIGKRNLKPHQIYYVYTTISSWNRYFVPRLFL